MNSAAAAAACLRRLLPTATNFTTVVGSNLYGIKSLKDANHDYVRPSSARKSPSTMYYCHFESGPNLKNTAGYLHTIGNKERQPIISQTR